MPDLEIKKGYYRAFIEAKSEAGERFLIEEMMTGRHDVSIVVNTEFLDDLVKEFQAKGLDVEVK